MTAGNRAVDARFAVRRDNGFVLDLALTLAPDERIAVMGPSGAGKSTLIAALAGFVRIDEGVIRLGGRELSSAGARPVHIPPMNRGIAVLGQDPRLFPHLSARENIAFGPRARGVGRAEASRQADEWLERVGLADAGARRPAELSGGQQQRVALARALSVDPALVLLDEPLTSLDPETAAGIRVLLTEHLTASAIIVTHDAVDAVALAHGLLVIENGRITQSGPVREVLRAPATGFSATLSGLVRVVGAVAGGWWTAGPLRLPCSAPEGSVAAVIRPDRVALAPVSATSSRSGIFSPGTWRARVTRLEQTIGAVRVHTAEPAVAVDVASDIFAELELTPGVTVELTVTPGEVRFVPD